MSTKPALPKASESTSLLLSMREIGIIILERNGIHEGLFDVKAEFQIGSGGIGPSPANLLPGIMFGISKVGLAPSEQPNASTIDASLVNPLKKKATSKKA